MTISFFRILCGAIIWSSYQLAIADESVNKNLVDVGVSDAGVTSNAMFDRPVSFLDGPVFLPVDEAFKLSATKEDGVLKLYWQISPGYYLYKHRLNLSGNRDFGDMAMASGKKKVDEHFGQVEVYYEELDVTVPFTEDGRSYRDDEMQITVEFQGCAEAGICYPPRKKQLSP